MGLKGLTGARRFSLGPTGAHWGSLRLINGSRIKILSKSLSRCRYFLILAFGISSNPENCFEKLDLYQTLTKFCLGFYFVNLYNFFV